MRGDFTRDSRDRAGRIATRSVLLQQGRQLLDDDWNTQAGLTAARAEKAAYDTIGQQGAPREDAGFEVTGSASNLSVGPGTMYVEGLKLHNPADRDFRSQFPWMEAPPSLDNLLEGEEGLAYLEVGTRPATEADYAQLPEPGLGGADTAVHEVAWWALRVAKLTETGMSRDDLIRDIDRATRIDIPQFARTTGGLTADVEGEDEVTDPGICELPGTAGYLDQVNRLYVVEIHDSGEEGEATFKWTADAGVEAGLRPEGSGFAVDLPEDRAGTDFPHGTIVEVIDPRRERMGLPGHMGTIDSHHTEALVILGVAASLLGPEVRLRRWSALPQPVPENHGWVDLDRGIRVRFMPGNYVSGSSWSVPARTRTGDILWPPYPDPDETVTIPGEGQVGFYLPGDGRRRYAALALVRENAAGIYARTEDLRQVFPPLTDLTADAVRYRNSDSELEAENVQDALDELAELARRKVGHCTYHATPGADWERIFDEIPPNGNATVCFPVGNYPLGTPRVVRAKGHIRLAGAGPGSKIWCYGNNSALQFVECRSVEVVDLTIAGENRSPWKPGEGTRTTGALDVRESGRVRVARCTLIGAGTKWRQAACLRVDADGGDNHGGGDVIVEDCDIVAGDLASGIIVLDPQSVSIRHNRIRPRGEPLKRTQRRWADDPTMSASMGRMVFSHARTTGVMRDSVTRSDTDLFPREQMRFGAVLGITAFTRRSAEISLVEMTDAVFRRTVMSRLRAGTAIIPGFELADPILGPNGEPVEGGGSDIGEPVIVTAGGDSEEKDHQDLVRFIGGRAVAPSVWLQFANAYSQRAKRFPKSDRLRLDLSNVMAAMWATGGRIEREDFKFDGLVPAVTTLSAAVAPTMDTAIVIAGQRAGQVCVEDNRIGRCFQGVRVAISNSDNKFYPVRSVRVERNHIRLAVVPSDKVRHGVMIGNVVSAWATDNDIALESIDRADDRLKAATDAGLEGVHSEGVRQYGEVEAMLQVRGNAIQRCRHGVSLTYFDNTGKRLVLVTGNVVRDAVRPWAGRTNSAKMRDNWPEPAGR